MSTENLIKDWERSAEKYHKLGMEADHNPIRQEGLLCRSEIYNYCASKLKESLTKGEQGVIETINEICTQLPEGWEIALLMKNGTTSVELIDASMNNIELPDSSDKTIVEQFKDALCLAKDLYRTTISVRTEL